MQNARQAAGQAGEDIATRFLVTKGYRILERGVHAGKMGELDIVARKDGMLVFVEVKARRNAKYGRPEEAVSYQKLCRLERSIEWYRQTRKLERLPYRLDVIAVDLSEPEPVIRHHPSVGVC